MVRLKDGETEVEALANLGPVYEEAMRQAAEGMRGLPFDSPSARSDLAQSRLKLESGSRGLAALREQFSKPLAFLMVVVGMLLLIACTNVANVSHYESTMSLFSQPVGRNIAQAGLSR